MSDPKVGIGGAPTRATTLPVDPKERKTYPIATGFMRYFPDAIVAVSHVSWAGNEQHNPGQPLHWARGKSSDEEDTMLRHFLQSGTIDTDGQRHSAKMVWRALAILQKEIEADAVVEPLSGTRRTLLEQDVDRFSKELKKFPKGPTGMTPDATKATPEWQAAKRNYDQAFQSLQNYNSKHTAADLGRRSDDVKPK
jgi:hypothetical protein